MYTVCIRIQSVYVVSPFLYFYYQDIPLITKTTTDSLTKQPRHGQYVRVRRQYILLPSYTCISLCLFVPGEYINHCMQGEDTVNECSSMHACHFHIKYALYCYCTSIVCPSYVHRTSIVCPLYIHRMSIVHYVHISMSYHILYNVFHISYISRHATAIIAHVSARPATH